MQAEPTRTGRDGDGPEVWTVVVAGGSGRRYGGAKQYELIAGKSALAWSISASTRAGTNVVAVVPSADVDSVSDSPGNEVAAVVAGGATRADSVRAGVAAIPESADVILVHDAARPAAPTDVFARVIDAVVSRFGEDPPVGVVPVVAVTDSLRHPDDGAVDRSELRAVQTPQGFPAAAFRSALSAGGDASDDATLFERFGGTIECVDGDPSNIKLTHPIDQVTLAAALTSAKDASSEETR